MDQFRLGLWEFKSKVCFYTQEICDTYMLCENNEQRTRDLICNTDHKCFCEKSKVQTLLGTLLDENSIICGEKSQMGIASGNLPLTD